jgi:hypothetical protein
MCWPALRSPTPCGCATPLSTALGASPPTSPPSPPAGPPQSEQRHEHDAGHAAPRADRADPSVQAALPLPELAQHS